MDGNCMCGAEACPINGECVRPGDCPRYAGSSCTIFQLTGQFPCDVGQCAASGFCMCPEGTCFKHGKCEAATSENVRLSREWGLSQGKSRAVQEGVMARATAAGAFGMAATTAFGFRATSIWRAQGEADRYKHLDS